MALLIGAGLRWFQIGNHSFWYDEALSGLIARLSTTQIVANAAGSDHPPGYYLLLHYWLALGQSEATIRTLSAVLSLGAIPLVFGLGSWLWDQATGAVAALGMALFPFQIYFAQEARMYGLAIFLAAVVIWFFLYATSARTMWWAWVGYALSATMGLYTHYFIAFLLLGLHLWLVIGPRRNRSLIGRLILADSVITLLFLPQVGQALTRTEAYLLGSGAWQSSPLILSPFTTIYYLLFGHRAPFWLVPIGLFLALTVLLLTLWESRRRAGLEREYEFALWLCLLAPLAAVLIISWLIHPIYLERSFAITTPALVLLLARGGVAAPRRSPTPYLLGLLLTLPILVTLWFAAATEDPAKPPIREAARMVQNEFLPGDVSLHLQDASCLPALWYTPDVPHLLANVPGATWTSVATHHLFGGDVVDWQTATPGADRLWLTVMPGYNDPEQIAVKQAIEKTFPLLAAEDWGAIQVFIYDLGVTGHGAND